MIGSGYFGSVYLAKDKATGKQCALKQISCQIMNPNHQEYLNREIKIMSQIYHPSLIQMKGFNSPYDSFETYDNKATIIMDFIPNGSLYDILKMTRNKNNINIPNWNPTTKNKILIGIASGMKYLHNMNIIHRDLKTANILLDENFEPKITDFGLSKIIDDNSNSPKNTPNIGTPLYMAPEIISNNSYSFKVDVYAFGVIMYEIITGLPLYPEIKNPVQLATKVCNGGRPLIPDEVQSDFRSLISRCWNQDPYFRPTFNEIYIYLVDKKRQITGANRKQLDLYIEKVENSNNKSFRWIEIENQLIRQKQKMEEIHKSFSEILSFSVTNKKVLRNNLETVKNERYMIKNELQNSFRKNEELMKKITKQHQQMQVELKQLRNDLMKRENVAIFAVTDSSLCDLNNKHQNIRKRSSNSLTPLHAIFPIYIDQINTDTCEKEDNDDEDDFYKHFENLDCLEDFDQNIMFNNEENISYNCFDKSAKNWFNETYPPNNNNNSMLKKKTKMFKKQKVPETSNLRNPESTKNSPTHIPKRATKLNVKLEVTA